MIALRRFSAAVPPWHRLLFVLAVLLVLSMLMVGGLAAHLIGKAGTGVTTSSNAPLAHSGPLLAAGRGGLVPIGSPPGRRIALTFDDGPSPWTPKIMAVLRRNHVPATFFVIGSEAARYRGILRTEVAQGFTIGNHTFTHVDPSTVPTGVASAEVALTNSVVAGITGFEPRLFRPPYSSTPAAVTPHQLQSFAAIARHGNVIVLSDYNSEDWARPGVAQIVRNATPPGRRGGVIMFHDGGGNRIGGDDCALSGFWTHRIHYPTDVSNSVFIRTFVSIRKWIRLPTD